MENKILKNKNQKSFVGCFITTSSAAVRGDDEKFRSSTGLDETTRQSSTQRFQELTISEDAQQRTDEGMKKEQLPGVGNENCGHIKVQRIETNITDDQHNQRKTKA